MNTIHNMDEMIQSESILINAMRIADNELMSQICCYEKLGGYENTIETLKQKRGEIGLIISHAQNNCAHWKNSNSKFKKVMDFSI